MDAWRAALAGPPRSFTLDGEVYELAGAWRALLEHLPLEGWHLPLLYALLHEEDADALDDRLDDLDDPLTLTVVRDVAEGLVEQATGRRWWTAQRLYATAASSWDDLDGAVTLHGGDLLALAAAPARFCAAVYAWLTKNADSKAKAKVDAALERPPAGLDLARAPLWTAEEEGSAFMAALAAHQQRS